MTPFLTTREATISLVIFCAVYAFIFLFGAFYIYRLIYTGPRASCSMSRIAQFQIGRCHWPTKIRFNRQATSAPENDHGHVLGRAFSHQHSTHVLLDGVDLGIGSCSGWTNDEGRRG